MTVRRIVLAGLCAAMLVAAPGAHATLQPPPPEGPLTKFAATDPKSVETYGYLIWTKILGIIVSEDDKGRSNLDYGGLGLEGRNALNGFIDEMTSMNVSSLKRDEQLAYWLNLYNAATLRLMLDQFFSFGSADRDFAGRNPYASERFDVKRLYKGKENPWTVRNLTVEGVTLSLNDIEYRILYPLWPEDPVVYGLSCPLRGCPSLTKQAFQGGMVHKQLQDAAARFIGDNANVTIKGDTVKLSELYQQPVFGGEAKVLEHLRQYADNNRKLELFPVKSVSGYGFDWKLAGKQPPANWRLPQGQMNRGAGAGGQLQE